MSNDFPVFSKAVHKNYSEMQKHELFVVDVEDLFTHYLLAFPEGTNEIYREKTEHDCTCCKNFIRNLGAVVAIVEGQRRTVWDCSGIPHPYNEVSKQLHNIVMQAPIKGVFRTKEGSYGKETTKELREGGHVHTWHHFHGSVARKHLSNKPADDAGRINTFAQVFERGLNELKITAIIQVQDLINDGLLYRGDEHKRALDAFLTLKVAYANVQDKQAFVWNNVPTDLITKSPNPIPSFRNTVIGTLVTDLSDGVDLESAVKMFESKVAPHNYKRSKALVTPKMIDQALAKLDALGLSDAVHRRFARIEDVAVTDVRWIDNSVRGQMKGGLRDSLLNSKQVKKPSLKLHDPEVTTMDWFLEHILPETTGMEILVQNQHVGNFVSITAPEHANSGKLFRWKNDFAWSYEGEVADSIKERVKRAGGNTGAALRVSLAWFNADDLDLHCIMNRQRIYYANPYLQGYNTTRILDVDMNAGGRMNEVDPVENLSWANIIDGDYTIIVDRFNTRSTKNPGFEIQIECNGVVQNFQHIANAKKGEEVLSFKIVKGQLVDLKLDSSLKGGLVSTDKWGVKTETLVPVNTLMLSPNHWDGAGGVGNKHWFFMLKDCVNPEAVRGIYNEFLRSDLEPHRKVFEVLGAQTKCQPTPNQLSGLGFSAGRGDAVTVAVNTKAGKRQYEINF